MWIPSRLMRELRRICPGGDDLRDELRVLVSNRQRLRDECVPERAEATQLSPADYDRLEEYVSAADSWRTRVAGSVCRPPSPFAGLIATLVWIAFWGGLLALPQLYSTDPHWLLDPEQSAGARVVRDVIAWGARTFVALHDRPLVTDELGLSPGMASILSLIIMAMLARAIAPSLLIAICDAHDRRLDRAWVPRLLGPELWHALTVELTQFRSLLDRNSDQVAAAREADARVVEAARQEWLARPRLAEYQTRKWTGGAATDGRHLYEVTWAVRCLEQMYDYVGDDWEHESLHEIATRLEYERPQAVLNDMRFVATVRNAIVHKTDVRRLDNLDAVLDAAARIAEYEQETLETKTDEFREVAAMQLGFLVSASKQFESLLSQHFDVTGRGLLEMVYNIEDDLDEDVVRRFQAVGRARNRVVHSFDLLTPAAFENIVANASGLLAELKSAAVPA